jgi:hypothetical protein
MFNLDFLSFRMQDIQLPKEYERIWNDINLPIQEEKISRWKAPKSEKQEILSMLSKRAYFLTTIASTLGAKNIVEIGTNRGWQFFSFAEYCRSVKGQVWSCDIIDYCDKEYLEKYNDVANYIIGDSKQLSDLIESKDIEIDLFYIDGSHDKGAVITDVVNLKKIQSKNKKPIWIFDDFDERFGCYDDIYKILRASPNYYVYSHGKTASGKPNHQAIVKGFIA